MLNAFEDRRPLVLLESSSPAGDESRSYLFLEPVDVLTTTRPEELHRCLERLEAAVAGGLWAAGWFSYEFGYFLEPALRPRYSGRFPLLWFALFSEPVVFDHATGAFTPPLPRLPTREDSAPDFSVIGHGPSLTRKEYGPVLGRIKDRIAAGDTYQVNFTMKHHFRFQGSPIGLYLSCRDNQPVPYAAFLRTGERDILSASPELFFRKEGRDLVVKPMKGTMARGRTAAEDARQAERLAKDPKNRAENVMIVDLVRNDLGRICLPGSVSVSELYRVESLDTLLQMTSTVRGRLRPGTTLRGIFEALFPCGSVTGAPKIRTMEIISDTEKEERGVYCGAIGFFSPHGRAVFSVPIRTVVLEGDRGEMGIGSGIVADSEAPLEYDECLLKGRFLTHPLPALRLIETLRWQSDRGFTFLEDHLDRLTGSADYFRFSCPRSRIRLSLEEEGAAFPPGRDRRVRVLLERGGTWEICSAPLDPAPDGPLPVRLAPVTVDSSDPYLYHKTTRRQVYDSQLQSAGEEGFYEVIFTNEKGQVTEGAFTNFFLEREGRLVTPPVGCGLLDGVLRRRLLREGRAVEGIILPEDLAGTARLFVGNSVRGLVEVKAPGSAGRA